MGFPVVFLWFSVVFSGVSRGVLGQLSWTPHSSLGCSCGMKGIWGMVWGAFGVWLWGVLRGNPHSYSSGSSLVNTFLLSL